MSEPDDATGTITTTVIEPAVDPTPAERSDASSGSTASPTVRWGALVWSLLFGGLAAATLWVVLEPGRRNVVGAWLVDLTPLAAALYLLLAVGALIAVFGIVALIRRGERERTRTAA